MALPPRRNTRFCSARGAFGALSPSMGRPWAHLCCFLHALGFWVPAEIFGGPLVTMSRDFSYSAFWCSRRGGSAIFNVLGSFWGCFLECLGRPSGTLSVPLSSLVGSSGAFLHTWGPQGRLFGNLWGFLAPLCACRGDFWCSWVCLGGSGPLFESFLQAFCFPLSLSLSLSLSLGALWVPFPCRLVPL